MQTPNFMKPELAPNGHSPPLLSSTSGCIPAPGMALRASLSSSFPIVVPYIAVSTSARTLLHVLPKFPKGLRLQQGYIGEKLTSITTSRRFSK